MLAIFCRHLEVCSGRRQQHLITVAHHARALVRRDLSISETIRMTLLCTASLPNSELTNCCYHRTLSSRANCQSFHSYSLVLCYVRSSCIKCHVVLSIFHRMDKWVSKYFTAFVVGKCLQLTIKPQTVNKNINY